MAKFVIDRRNWYHGNGLEGSKLLREQDGMRCCIGFVGQQVGCSDDALLNVADVKSMHYDANKFPSWIRDPYSSEETNGLTLIGRAYQTNDYKNLTEEQREARLKEIFAEAGDEIEFIN